MDYRQGKATKGDWLLFGFQVIMFFVLGGVGVYQLQIQGDAASSDEQDVVETADARAEIETNESMNTQRGQETSLKSTKAQASQAQSGPRSAEPTMEKSEQREARGSIDTDGDRVADVDDRCEDTQPGMGVGADGCRLTGIARDPIDKDEDLVADYLDKCPMTVEGAKVDEKGCVQMEQPLARLEDVLFERGGAAVTPKAEATLIELVSILEDNPDIRVRLEGYTDNVGSESGNEMLSQKRAEAVKDYLISEGVDASRIKTIGMGESNPIATNATEQGRAQNRRVSISGSRHAAEASNFQRQSKR